jgi:hypothetical protein
MGTSSLVFEDGSEAGPSQGIYVHHILSRDISKSPNLPVQKCGNDQTSNNPIRKISGFLGSEFTVQGDDAGKAATVLFTSSDGKYNSGFFVGPQDTFLIQTDLVNYNPDSKKVYVAMEIEYVDGNVGSDAVATLMSVTGCHPPTPGNGPAINLSKTGPAITNSTQWPVIANGKVIAGCKSSLRIALLLHFCLFKG